jgi:quercetin dioxygenase-like cupin family protein
MNKGEVISLINLSNYKKNSIISQTIIDNKCGTVTFFTFDEGQGLSEHSTPYDALIHILDGEAEITIEGNKNILKKGEMIIMPADKPHALQAIKRFKMILIMFLNK